MLLGNNLLKPLEAQIKLFKEGDGTIKLGDDELEMKETKGGHYTVKVQDLSKLCSIATESFLTRLHSSCNECGKGFENADLLDSHKERVHTGDIKESILKNSIVKEDDFNEENNCIHKVIEDLNTQLNGKLSSKDKIFMKIMKRMAQIQQVDSNFKCDMCERKKRSKGSLNNHTICEHGLKVGHACRLCEKETRNKSNLKVHTGCEHMITLGKECYLCQLDQSKEEVVKTHHSSESTLDQIFLSHHQEENNEDEDELPSDLWNTLLVDDDDSG